MTTLAYIAIAAVGVVVWCALRSAGRADRRARRFVGPPHAPTSTRLIGLDRGEVRDALDEAMTAMLRCRDRLHAAGLDSHPMADDVAATIDALRRARAEFGWEGPPPSAKRRCEAPGRWQNEQPEYPTKHAHNCAQEAPRE